MVSSRLHTNIYQSGSITVKGGIDMPVIRNQFTLRLLAVDHAKIKKIADRENRSLTNMIETLVKNEIKRYETEHGEIELTDEDLSIR